MGSDQVPPQAADRGRHRTGVTGHRAALPIFCAGPRPGFGVDPCPGDACDGRVPVWNDVQCLLVLDGWRHFVKVTDNVYYFHSRVELIGCL